MPHLANSPLLGYHGRHMATPPVGYKLRPSRSLKRRHTSAAGEWLRQQAVAPGRQRKVRLAVEYIFYATAACVVVLFVTVWSSHRSATRDAQPEHLLNRLARGKRLPPHLRRGTPRPPQRTAWVGQPPAEDGIAQSWLPGPHSHYRWTFFRAGVREQLDTYRSELYGGERFLQVLGFVERTPPRREPDESQLAVDVGKIVKSASCTYRLPKLGIWSGEGSIRYGFPGRDYALLVHCPIPPTLPTIPSPRSDDVHTVVTLHLEGGLTFSHAFMLKTVPVNPQSPSSPTRIGVCTKPVEGELDEREVLEWRAHHWLMGVSTVHWYDRTKGHALRDWVKRWNEATGGKDTWGAAPIVSPETQGGSFLGQRGESGDQTLYYLDCQARARTTHPTEWLAFTSLSEWLLPTSFPEPGEDRSRAPSVGASASLSSFLASQDRSVGSLCFGKTVPYGPEVGHPPSFWDAQAEHDSDELRLASITHHRAPQAWDDAETHRCIHRSSALEIGTVHRPVTYYPLAGEGAKAYEERFVGPEDSDAPAMRILRMEGREGKGDEVTPFPLSTGLVYYLGELNEARRTIAEAMDWPCTTIPCR